MRWHDQEMLDDAVTRGVRKLHPDRSARVSGDWRIIDSNPQTIELEAAVVRSKDWTRIGVIRCRLDRRDGSLERWFRQSSVDTNSETWLEVETRTNWGSRLANCKRPFQVLRDRLIFRLARHGRPCRKDMTEWPASLRVCSTVHQERATKARTVLEKTLSGPP